MPSAAASDSMVRTSLPSACTAKVRQERADLPSMMHGAGAANAVLAADMGAGEAELVAQEIATAACGR